MLPTPRLMVGPHRLPWLKKKLPATESFSTLAEKVSNPSRSMLRLIFASTDHGSRVTGLIPLSAWGVARIGDESQEGWAPARPVAVICAV